MSRDTLFFILLALCVILPVSAAVYAYNQGKKKWAYFAAGSMLLLGVGGIIGGLVTFIALAIDKKKSLYDHSRHSRNSHNSRHSHRSHHSHPSRGFSLALQKWICWFRGHHKRSKYVPIDRNHCRSLEVCERCGKVTSLGETDHTFGKWESSSMFCHRSCTQCGYEDEKTHVFTQVEEGCTIHRTCQDCGYQDEFQSHTFVEIHGIKDVPCLTKGVRCQKCGLLKEVEFQHDFIDSGKRLWRRSENGQTREVVVFICSRCGMELKESTELPVLEN
jgi:hypothetical protein